MKKPVLLVTGASGQLGQLVLANLIKLASDHKIIGTTRHPESLQGFADTGVEIRALDFDSPVEEIAKSFSGVDRVLLISTNDFSKRLEQHKKAIEAAKQAKVKRILYTSWLNTDTSKSLVASDHYSTEKYIIESGIEHTFLRNSFYAENIAQTIQGALARGSFVGAAGNGAISYITREDCALAATQALLNHSGRSYTINIAGPEAFSYQQLAQLLSEFKGAPVVYTNLAPEKLQETYIQYGLPKEFAHLLVDFDLSAQRGELQPTNKDLSTLLGKQPIKLKEYIAQNFSKT